MADQVTVVVKPPGQAPRLIRVLNDLEAFKAIVGGWLEEVRFARKRRLYLFCNDAGQIESHPPNLAYSGGVICGTVFIAACRGFEGSFVDLVEEDLEVIEHQLGPVDRTSAASSSP